MFSPLTLLVTLINSSNGLWLQKLTWIFQICQMKWVILPQHQRQSRAASTHIQSFGIRTAKCGVCAAPSITRCLCNGGVKCKPKTLSSFKRWYMNSARADRAKHPVSLHFLALLFPPLHNNIHSLVT